MFSKEERCIYQNNQLADVICQLRFPTILAIDVQPPVDFQEAIRQDFPQYQLRKEPMPPKVIGTPGNLRLDQPPASVNHQFVSTDENWRVNLTSGFISLSCAKYTCWEDFAKQLDRPLAAFIQIYKPAYFERVGLRYLNFFSRKSLSLEGTPFSELFQPQYLGILSDDEISEPSAAHSSVDGEFAIRSGCRAKIHAGPGLVKRSNRPDPEVKFIFDQDLYMTGKVPVNYSAGALETLHSQAYPLFRGAITKLLHNALEPSK